MAQVDTQPLPLPPEDAAADAPAPARRNPAHIRTVVAYLRTAQAGTDAQRILQRQRTELQGEIDFQGWKVIRWIEDAHQSGTTLDRHGLKQALTLLASGYVDALLCTNITRLTASTEATLKLAAHMGQYGWQLITLATGSEPITVDLVLAEAAGNAEPRPA